MDKLHIIDYMTHWWNGDVSKFYQFIWLEVPQANKVFKIGLYSIGLTALFDLISFQEVVCNVRGVYCAVTFTFKVVRSTLNLFNIFVKLMLIPAYYVMSLFDKSQRVPFKELVKIIATSHISTILNDARNVTSRKWINRLLLWMEQNPPSDRQIRVTVYSLFVVLAALEIITS